MQRTRAPGFMDVAKRTRSAHAHQGSWMWPNARVLVHHVHHAHRAGSTLYGNRWKPLARWLCKQTRRGGVGRPSDGFHTNTGQKWVQHPGTRATYGTHLNRHCRVEVPPLMGRRRMRPWSDTRSSCTNGPSWWCGCSRTWSGWVKCGVSNDLLSSRLAQR